MQNKKHAIEELQKDLMKYCKQINVQEPTLVFKPKDFDAINHSKRRTKRDKVMGYCSYTTPLILVNLEYLGLVTRWEYSPKGKVCRVKRSKWNLKEARHTLVHELVHYRWPTMWHGFRFEKRIGEIMRGRTFEPKPDEVPSPKIETEQAPPRLFIKTFSIYN